MAGNIKGITIEFRGDTTKLDRALYQLNTKTKSLDKELKAVDRALKFNPSNVDLWRQKQQILNDKVKETKEKLDVLKQAQAQMDADGVDKTSQEYRELQREIIESESKLKMFKKQLMEVGNANLTALGEQFKQVGKKMTDLGKTLSTKVTAPIVGVFAASAKSAISFGDSIAKVSTIADTTQVPIDQLKKNILDLSNQSGKSANELAEATYQALSASVETKDVAGFVGDAANLAKAGFLETADSVDVLTTIINAYGYEAKDAAKISDQLVQTQNDGKTTVNELAQAMGQVIPTASALNIPLEQLNASYVLLTKQGINTANSTTYLNGMFTELADGGSTVSKILQEKTGKTFGELMQSGATLGDVMGILNESVDGDSEAFLNLWGNARAGRGALALLNGGVDEFNKETKKMEKSSGNVGKALKKLQTPGAAARKALNSIVNAGIELGDVLAPYVEKVAKVVTKLAKKFSELSPETKKVIVVIGAVAAAIGPALITMGKLATGIGSIIKLVGMASPAFSGIATFLSGPFGIAIGVAVAAGVLLYKNWDTIKETAIKVKDAVVKAWNDLKTNVSNIFNAVKDTISTVWNTIKSTASTVWNAIKTTIVNLVEGVRSGVVSKWESLKSSISNIFNSVKSTITSIWTNIKTTVANLVQGIKDKINFGGIVDKVKKSVSGVKDALSGPFQKARELVQSAINKIKGIFPIKLGKIFSGVKLPHFKISGGKIPWGIGGAGKKPTVSIEWYKQGGIMTKPTLFGGGEAGAEAIMPLDPFWKKMDKLIEATEANSGGVTVNVYGTAGMNVEELADAVERRLVLMQKQRAAVWQI